MTQYPAILEPADLDGTNGYVFLGAHEDGLMGYSVASAGDVDGDGFDDLLIGAPGFVDGSHGESYIVFGGQANLAALDAADGNTDGIITPDDLDGSNGFRVTLPVADGYCGRSVSSAGDVNGDGFADFIIGSERYGGDLSGAAFVVFGKGEPFNPTLNLANLNGRKGFKIEAAESGYEMGRTVTSAGDVNGDGFDDLIIGSEGGGNFRGTSYLIFGHGGDFDSSFALSAIDGINGYQFLGVNDSEDSGCAVSSAGDVNGDGLADLLIGARHAQPDGEFTGASYVVFGGVSLALLDAADGVGDGTASLAHLNGSTGFRLDGGSELERLGTAVSSAGDINGDGFDDIVVGAPTYHTYSGYAGRAYVVFGGPDVFNPSMDVDDLDGANGFRIDALHPNDGGHVGASVSGAGDFNGDGFADILVSAPYSQTDSTTFNAGITYLIFGKASGFDSAFALTSIDGKNGIAIHGVDSHDMSGFSVSGAGDVNGDGFDDLIVGAVSADAAGYAAGASYLIYGAMPGEAVTRTGTAIANTIHGGDFDDTLNGLNGNDMLYGHDGRDTLIGGNGKDTLSGGAGKDTVLGGKSADRFVYGAVSDSTGAGYDLVKGADFDADRWDVAGNITGIDAAIATGKLTVAGFDGQLAARVDAAHLGAHHAVLFTPSKGNLSGQTFLIVDQNGVAGYQTGADLVVELKAPVNLANIDAGDFI